MGSQDKTLLLAFILNYFHQDQHIPFSFSRVDTEKPLPYHRAVLSGNWPKEVFSFTP